MGLAGIDRISISFPIEDWDHRPQSWQQVTTKNAGSDNESRSYGLAVSMGEGLPSTYVGVSDVKAAGLTKHRNIDGSLRTAAFGKVEFNPSRVVDPTGWGLAPVSALRRTIEMALDAALEVLRPNIPIEDMRVKRLDVARDFATENGEFFIRGLAPLPRSWARRNLVHFDPSRNHAQTLMVGSGAGIARLYDKFAETEGAAPEGTLRWEAECRSDWAANYGNIASVEDINEESVAQLAMNRWEWSAMGTDVGAIDRVFERASRAGLSNQQLLSFLGYVTAMKAGASHRVSKNVSTKYRRLARQLGVSIEGLEGSSAEFLGRLDWETGREVLHAA